jgi:tetratricopeptide (TPR) repeat protein/tRNA A-37 threonylcarbamoyl transferase component Bud32
MDLPPDTRLGHYEIRAKLGAGGMGEVYLAEDTRLKRKVAIKFLLPDLTADPQAKSRLLREAQAAAKLDHPNICAVHEVAEEDGRSFIVMPYVEGQTLDVRMKLKPLDISESLSVATQVADALAEAHSHGIIHRDIKPSNIIITPRGQARVMDFGLAKLSAAIAVDEEASTQVLLTTPGTIIGTVRYMSPEQVHGQPLDARTDVFSFGVVLYEMLTGHHPFAAESPAGTMSAILTKQPAPVSDYLKACPIELQQIVAACLAKDRESRYQTMRDVGTDLESLRRESEGGVLTLRVESKRQFGSKPTDLISARRTRLNRWALVSAAVFLIACALIAYLVLLNSRTPSTAALRDPDSAADMLLRAKVLMKTENREDNENAINLLKRAVAADPNFALAWAELARAYNSKSFYYAPEQGKQLDADAQFADEKALSIDPNLAEAHLARGVLLWTHSNRFPHEQSIQAYKRALVLNPNLDEAHHQLGLVYFHIGLLDKAWAEIQKAVELNPSNTYARFRFGVVDLYRGKYEDALAIFHSTPLDKNPSLWAFQTATALFQLGRTDEATALIEEYLSKYPKDEGGVGTSVKAMILARAGRAREAEGAIKHAIEIGNDYGHFHHTAYNIASAYALMNEPEPAIKWLQYAADDGFPCYPLFDNDANLTSLRKDERFVAFMAKLKQQWERYNATL